MAFSLDDAKKLVEGGIGEAQELLKNPSKIDGLLEQLEDKLRGIPVGGDLLASVPLMIAMVKSYINGSYKEVSPKVIASLVAAFLYLVKRKDLIPDNIPLVGHVDDLAVLGVALKICEPELKAFAAWRDGQ
ncbi:MAG: DUF1232 domain-containing protein [Clostridia bacterium]|jgi:uncharacterized membrane protein YkvA (DUF1232 family)|nr:DUF1232 domain-containing protein [Clostridia bacterium]MBR0215981.1 DUF1232 domain-containing protein [Clostridia bacterium]